MTADYYAKQDDVGSSIGGVLKDADGAVPIAGATLRFIMTPVDGWAAKIAAAATNGQDDDAGTGAWSYTFTGTDLSLAGWFRAEVEVTFGDGSVKTYPNDGYEWVLVSPDLD